MPGISIAAGVPTGFLPETERGGDRPMFIHYLTANEIILESQFLRAS